MYIQRENWNHQQIQQIAHVWIALQVTTQSDHRPFFKNIFLAFRYCWALDSFWYIVFWRADTGISLKISVQDILKKQRANVAISPRNDPSLLFSSLNGASLDWYCVQLLLSNIYIFDNFLYSKSSLNKTFSNIYLIYILIIITYVAIRQRMIRHSTVVGGSDKTPFGCPNRLK